MQKHYFKLLIFACYFGLLFSSQIAFSQNFSNQVKVDEVDFLAPVGMDAYKISILRDYFPNPLINEIAWKYPDNQTPVAFYSGTSARVIAKFIGCEGVTWAKGDGPGNYDPPVMPITSSTYTGVLPAFTPNKVDFYEPFEITWYISRSETGPWIEVGKSQNPLYITYGQVPVGNFSFFHSLIYYGCKNAKGLTSPNDIVDNMYIQTFSSLVLPRRDNPTKPAMSYWAWPETPGQPQPVVECFSAQNLLKWENGRCSAWSEFFRLMIELQGINGAVSAEVKYSLNQAIVNKFSIDVQDFFEFEAINVIPELVGQILVNDWNIVSTYFYTHDYEWTPIGTPSPVTIANGNILNNAALTGVPAQGNENPESTFNNHDIIKYNGKYYDPSYGTSIKNSKDEWENGALSGFGLICKFMYNDGTGLKEIQIFWVNEKNNIFALQSTITP
jgi:hypothetical protein